MMNLMKNRKTNDDGGALVTVMIVSFTIFIFTMSAILWTMSSLQTTNIHHSQNQALAASESARDEAIAMLNDNNNSCIDNANVDMSKNHVSANYQLYHLVTDREAEDIPQDVIGTDGELLPNIRRGCPVYSSGDEERNTFVYVVGEGESRGFSHQTVSVFEARWLSSTSSFVYGAISYGNFDFQGTSGIFGDSNLMVAKGSLICTSMSRITGSVHILDPESNSNIGNCGIIDGDLITAGDVHMNGGNQGLIVNGDLCVEGRILAMHHSGNLGVQVAGSYRHGGGPGSCPQLQAAAQYSWTDYDPDLSDAVTITDPNMCANNHNAGGWDAKGPLIRYIESLRTDTVIDLTQCNVPLAVNGHTAGNIPLRANVTIVVNNIASSHLNSQNGINALNIRSGDGRFHEFNIIVPDRITPDMDPQRNYPYPHCEGRQVNITQLDFDRNTAGLIYSPCGGVNPSRGNFRGMLYVGDNGFRGGGSNFTHVDIGGTPDNDGEYYGGNGIELVSTKPLSHVER